MKLSIIIVNYNVKYFLEHCLHAAMLATRAFQAEVMVVDNHSSDGSMVYLKPKFPSVIFMENVTNVGFAKANNQALQKAKGEYILYLNPDTLIAENTLERCIRFLDEHKNVSAASVQMMDGAGIFLPESKRSLPTPATSFYKLFLLEKLFPKSKTFGKYALGYLDKNKAHQADVLSGAFLMARAVLLRAIKGFDERYFMYGEDIDLSYSLQKLHYENYYLGNISIVHFKGESTKKGNIRYVKIFYRAMILFVEKHYVDSSKFIYRNFLKLGIAVRSSISAIGSIFYRKKKTVLYFEKIFLIGNDFVARQAIAICKKYFPDAEMMIKSYDEQNIIPKNSALIFCIDEQYTYLQAIDFIGKNAPVENVFWFYENADSIIGSGNKNSSGEVFV